MAAQGQRHRPEPGVEQTGVVDDPRQHREGRDGHGRGNEKAALPMHHVTGEVAAEADHPPTEKPAEGQRHTDAGGGGDTGLPDVGAEDVELERRPHQEHVEHQTELAQDIDRREVGVGERLRPEGQLGGEQPELRGFGQIQPRTDGPSKNPATMIATTCTWPSRRNSGHSSR